MKRQEFPLYATTGNGQVYLVVGWLDQFPSPQLIPILAPVSHPGPVVPLTRGAAVTYSATAPGINRPSGREVRPSVTIGAGETVTLPKVRE
jgi:hypothetical protein